MTNAYINGFLTKCAEYGVDGHALLKSAGPLNNLWSGIRDVYNNMPPEAYQSDVRTMSRKLQWPRPTPIQLPRRPPLERELPVQLPERTREQPKQPVFHGPFKDVRQDPGIAPNRIQRDPNALPTYTPPKQRWLQQRPGRPERIAPFFGA